MAIDLLSVGMGLVAGGGGGAVAYQAFKTYAAKWLDSRFARQLEQVRQDHAREIEHLRFRIAGLLDRSTKLNQREFDVLPIVWEKVDEAHSATMSLIAMYKEGIDAGSMNDAQLDALLERSSLEDWQKAELKSKSRFERTTYYSEIERWQELRRARIAVSELSQTLSKNSIYLHPDVFERINQFTDVVAKVVHFWRIDQEMRAAGGEYVKPDPNNDPIGSYRSDGQKAFDELQSFLQQRHWDAPGLADDQGSLG